MRKQTYSIFNDVIGPVMTGPSSSHTAGPAKIGYTARQLLDSEPAYVVFTFNEGGSFAAAYEYQGTDRGLVGGMLGYMPENVRMLTALEDAKVKGLAYEFQVKEFEANHPNTVIIDMKGRTGEQASLRGISVGGGIIEIQAIDGFPVKLSGKNWLLLVYGGEEEMLNGLSADEVLVSERDGKKLFLLKYGEEISEERVHQVEEMTGCRVKRIAPVFPVLDCRDEKLPFRTGEEMLSFAEENGYSIGEAGLYYEAAKGGITPDEVKKIAGNIVDIMEEGISENLASRRPGRLIKAVSGDYLTMAKQGKLVNLGAADKIIAYTMAMVERNSYYKTIVAAPTSGACGTVPGTIMGVADEIGAGREETIMAVLAAGTIGLLIADQSTFAAEVGGCMAECGAASAMAAAAVIELMGGNCLQGQEAASIALQNVLGMICDSVATLVEVPCLGRNVLGGVGAVSAANMVLAGERCVIPIDETVGTMYEVAKLMPQELCCTYTGGLAITKTSKKLAEIIREKGTAVEDSE